MKLLKISTAGVRGIVGRGMSASVAMDFALAFATYLEAGAVAVARDPRPSGAMMRSAVLGGLLSTGSRVVDFGIVPSPSARLRLCGLGMDGGIVIGAGHNPSPWNALKFVRPDGLYLDMLQGEELLEIYNHQEFLKAGWERIKPLEYDGKATEVHAAALEEAFGETIRSAGFKVVVDCCNGPCSLITPDLLRRLGCEVVVINDEMGAGLPRDPNPSVSAMAPLKAIVKAVGADVGFAHDAEGERLGVVTDQGEALDSETMLSLAALLVLAAGKRSGPLVTNFSTTMRLEDVAGRFDVAVRRTPVGQAYVAKEALESGAVMGGEGSGQIVLPWFQAGPDGVAAIALFLESLALLREPLSALRASLPETTILKEDLSFSPSRLYGQLQRVREAILREWGDQEVHQVDGIRVSFDGAWVHVRASGTESKLRVIVEARDRRQAREIREQVLEWVGS